MDANNSIERRYSFNAGQTSPVAESTHLGSSFSWGSSLSIKPRCNSSLCLNHTNSTAKYKNITKIDARIAADVQSKGLASRIVKYHESGARLNRSLSAHNLYSRPGQFPTVTLKKTELPYRATKKELSMIRIPPPEKSTFYGNTITSLLKSSSVVGLKSKRTEENRPIIHPPPSENDMAPTRSVLDVLKEISRKRINSDDLETDETSKKYCSRGVNDFIDAGACATSTTAGADMIASTNQCFKRQRDCMNQYQPVHIAESKTSPEQAKKRVCNYNNDITSSLSSSVKSRCNERKRNSCNLNQTMSPNLDSYETQKTKIQCFRDNQNNNDQSYIRMENLVNSSCKVDSVIPITPIPTIPGVLNESKTITADPKISNSFCSTGGNASTNKIQSADKPRLTLFNKEYEVELEAGSKKYTSKEDDFSNFDEYAGIPFVKPKKISTAGLKNPVIERTQKSKLALMLSGLRGEIYQICDKDDIDSSRKEEEKVEEKKLNIIKEKCIAPSNSVTSVTTTLTNVTSSCNLNSSSSTTDLTSNTTTNENQTVATPNKTSSPLVGLKLTQVKSSTNDDASSANDNKITDKNPKTDVPLLGGFSFSATNTSVSVTSESPISSTVTVSKDNSLETFGKPTTSSSFSIGPSLPTTKESTVSFSLTSTNSINSHANTPSLSNISLSTTNTSKPQNTFAFGVNATTTTKSNSSKTIESGSLPFSKPTTKADSLFNFSLPPQTSTESLTPVVFGSLTTISTTSSNTVLSKTTASGLTLGTVATTSTATSITPTITTFSLNQSKTSAPVAITNIPAGSSSTNTFSFSSQPLTTTVSTSSANTNTGTTIQSSNSLFSFSSLSKPQNSSVDDKNNSGSTKEANNIFSANPSSFFAASAKSPVFESSAKSIEKNIFGPSNAIFGSNSIKNESQIFGSSAETETKPSSFGGTSTNISTSVPFSFGTKPSDTQTGTDFNKGGGFSFGSINSKTSESKTFAFGNTLKPTTTTSSNNIFGAASSTSPENKTFTFGSTSNKTENTSTSSGGFSFSTPAAQKPTFSFGGNGNSTAGFSFGGVSSPLPAEVSNNKSFSFLTQQPQAQQSSMPAPNSAPLNIFSSPASSKTVSTPAFNFNSGSATNLQQSTVQSTNNIFAPTPSNITTGTGERVFRRATRRLQK